MAYQQAIQALADPTRRLVFERLRGGPLPVGRVARGLRVTRPAVSQHLRVLERAGLVKRTIDGRIHRCALERKRLRDANAWIDRYTAFWDEALDALAAFAEAKP